MQGHADNLFFVGSINDGQFIADLPRKYALLGVLFEVAAERRYDMNGILLLVDDYDLFISLELTVCDGVYAHFVLVIVFSVIETKVEYRFLDRFRIFILEVGVFLFL